MRTLNLGSTIAGGIGFTLAAGLVAAEAAQPHNVVLFVTDGLRSQSVNPTVAPTLANVGAAGVSFLNSHAVLPTFTMANGSTMATGHYLGDTGVFSNAIYIGFPGTVSGNTVTPFIENDAVIDQIDDHFGGLGYLNEETILAAARAAGYGTAAVGKVGPTLQFDPLANDGLTTFIIDDRTGQPPPNMVPLAADLQAALTAAGPPLVAPARGANGSSGNATTPGTLVPNSVQQDYFKDATTKAVLPLLQQKNKPFVLVFWSRDPDGTQHNQGDSLNKLVPGINGPTSKAAITNADNDLAAIIKALDDLGLSASTNIVVTADHGFSTISKQSSTSYAATQSYDDVVAGFLPAGFLAIDIAKGMNLPLADPDNNNAALLPGKHPKSGNGLIGHDPAHPDVIVAANGGSDLVYVPSGNATLAKKVVDILLRQDYTSGLFVNDKFGSIPGTLPLSAVNLKGTAVTPIPTIAVNFRSFVAPGCTAATPLLCAVEIADSGLQQGQGMHGSFSRADTFNFQAAMGPDFKHGFADHAPTSNADIGKTVAHLLQLDLPATGALIGRVLTEALPGGTVPASTTATLRSAFSANGLSTVVTVQQVGSSKYFDAAGFDQRTVGVAVKKFGYSLMQTRSAG